MFYWDLYRTQLIYYCNTTIKLLSRKVRRIVLHKKKERIAFKLDSKWSTFWNLEDKHKRKHKNMLNAKTIFPVCKRNTPYMRGVNGECLETIFSLKLDTGPFTTECLTEPFAVNNCLRYNSSYYNTPVSLYSKN